MAKKLDMSAQLLFEEAKKRGVSCQIFSDQQTILMLKDSREWYTRGSRTSWQSSVGHTIAKQKSLSKEILLRSDLPTAHAVQFDKTEEAMEKVSTLHYPVVLKPLSGAHGRGVVTDILSRNDLISIWTEQGKPKVLVEEQLEGTEYRILCIDYHFVAAAYRKPAFVTGDGKQNIAELIKEKNQHPWRGEGHDAPLTRIHLDDELKLCLQEQELELDSIPSADQEVYLRQTANLSRGGEAWDVTESVCEENKKLFEKVARVCDLNTIGIDVMCQDLSKPLTDQIKAGIIEVNASPGLRMHHYPMHGEAINAAGLILDMVERKLQS